MSSAPAPAADAFVGEIRLFGGKAPPAGWALCNGQTLPITDNQMLYSLIGTTYGGDGRTNFALPDLRGRLAIGFGHGAGLANTYTVGATGGSYEVTLTAANLPPHTHTLSADTGAATTPQPANAYFATTATNYTEYLSPAESGVNRVDTNASMLTSIGDATPHSNVMPVVCTSYIIALNGIYPEFP